MEDGRRRGAAPLAADPVVAMYKSGGNKETVPALSNGEAERQTRERAGASASVNQSENELKSKRELT